MSHVLKEIINSRKILREEHSRVNKIAHALQTLGMNEASETLFDYVTEVAYRIDEISRANSKDIDESLFSAKEMTAAVFSATLPKEVL